MKHCEELWISRAIDRRATADDWRALRLRAGDDPDVWRRLAASLEAETLLAHELGSLLPGGRSALDHVVPVADAVAEASPSAASSAMPRRSLLGLAAALLLFAFGLGRWSAGSPPANAPAGSTAPPSPDLVAMQAAPPDLLMHAYLRSGVSTGRVLDQLPLQTLSTRRAADGDGFDIVFVRSLIETARVDRLMTVAPDEHGRPQPLSVDLANYIPPTDY